MDVVHSINDANLILPAGDVRIGPYDYSLYTNSQLNTIDEINHVPLKMINDAPVLVGDVGEAKDGHQIQVNIVRVDGQHSVYLPVLKQGGDSNTIEIVNGVKKIVADLLDVPKSLKADVVFDQSVFVKTAIENLLHEGAIGLCLTGVMILVFLGKRPRHRGRLPFHPALGAGHLHLPFHGGGFDQLHDPRRLGSGLLPINRQFGGGAGKYLSSP